MCDCPPGYYGTDCSLVVPPDNPAHPCGSKYFDGAMINTNLNDDPKHLECFADITTTYGTFALRQHRINVTVYLDQAGKGNMTLDLISRHRNASDENPDTEYLCFPQSSDLRCTLTDCYAQTVGKTSTYTCQNTVCGSCGTPYPFDPLHDPTCAIMVWFMVRQMTGTLKFTVDNMDTSKGTGSFQMVTNKLTMDGFCYTGACVTEPVIQNFKAAELKEWVVLVVVGCFAGVMILILAITFYFNRRDKGVPVSFSDHESTVCGSGEPKREGDQVFPGKVLMANSDESRKSAVLELLEDHQNNLPTFAIIFEKVTYDVEISKSSVPWRRKTESRRILNEVSGFIRPKQLVAVLGSSGAGKSSLMNIISSRVQTGTVGGYVGVMCDSRKVRNTADIVSYVLQDDHILATATVREALLFSARTRLPQSFTEAMIAVKVNQVMKDLAITHISESKIGYGSDGGGISGGERKRVSIGLELVADPRFLMLDEPTTGLDSFSAQVVMRALRKAADSGCACMLSIHQPPADVFRMFDRVLLLTKLGEVAFFGPPEAALDHMTSTGHPHPEFINPAEYLLNIASQEDKDALRGVSRKYADSVHYNNLVAEMQQAEVYGLKSFISAEEKQKAHPNAPLRIHVPEGAEENGFSNGHHMVSIDKTHLPEYSKKQASFFNKFALLCGRSFLHVARDPSLLLLQFVVTALVAVFLGGIFWQVDLFYPGIQNRAGFLFFVIMYYALVSMTSIGVFVNDRILFSRERAAQYYTTLPYLLSKIICDIIPLRVLPPFVFGAICYWMVGLNEDVVRFSLMIVLLVLINTAATAPCFCASAAVKTAAQANHLVSLLFIFSMLFGGLLLNNSQDAGSRVDFLKYASFFHYGYEALMVNEFKDLILTFNPSGHESALVNGDVVLDFFGLDMDSFYMDIYLLVVYSTVFFVAAFFFLLPRKSKTVFRFNSPLFMTIPPKAYTPTHPSPSPTSALSLSMKPKKSRSSNRLVDEMKSPLSAKVPRSQSTRMVSPSQFDLVPRQHLHVTIAPETEVSVSLTANTDDLDSGSNSDDQDEIIVPQLFGFDANNAVAEEKTADQQSLLSDGAQFSEAGDPVLPHFGLVFDRITYSVSQPDWLRCGTKWKKILKGITGHIEANQMVAILGSSGAGKSSLMNIIGDRAQSGEIGGAVGLVSDNWRVHRRSDVVSYVLQDDCVLATQTVEEALLFSARLRLPPSYSEAVIKDKVRALMKDLAISHIARSRIGSSHEGGGISGGERKRLSIGMELIAEPRILLLDEPTSGLDSFSAKVVMRVLRKTADNGCACLLSIHQPPAEVFKMFDRVLLLTRLGEQAFFGPPMAAIMHLQQNGYPVKDQWVNPAEYLLDVASQNDTEALERLPRVFYSSVHYQSLRASIDAACKRQGSSYSFADSSYAPQSLPDAGKKRRSSMTESLNAESAIEAKNPSNGYAPLNNQSSAPGRLYAPDDRSMAVKFWLLCGRSFKNIYRSPALLWTQFITTVVVAGLIGGIFWQVSDDIVGIQNRIGSIFFLVVYFTFLSLSSIGSLVADRAQFLRERASKYYSTLPYFLSKLMCDMLPLRVIPPIVFGTIVYLMIGFRLDAEAFALFIVIVVLTNCTTTAMCFAASAAFPSVGSANLIASLIFVFSMLFGGLLLNNRTNGYLVDLKWTSFFHYAFESLMVNEFHTLQNLQFDPFGLTVQISGDDILVNFGLDPDWLSADIGILAAFMFSFMFLGYLLLLPCVRRPKVVYLGPNQSLEHAQSDSNSEANKAVALAQ